MLKLSFKQTKAEFMVRIASTLLFNQLIKAKVKTVSIREITESVQYGYTDKASDSEVGPKYVRITDLKDGRVNWETVPYCSCNNPEQYLLKQNDLIFARTGATTGKTHLFRETPPIAVFASYLIRVRPTKEINPEYLYFFFQSDLYWSQISSQKEGSAQPNVNGQKLSDIELPIADEETQKAICKFLTVVRERQDGFAQGLPELPYPLNEQPPIMERLEVIAARITDAQFLRNEINDETDLFFSRTLSKAYDEATTLAGDAERLEELCTVITDGTHVTPSYVDEGIPFLSVKDISSGEIDFSRTRFISSEEHAFLTKRCKPERDDILLTKVGTTGIAKVVDVDREFSIFVSIALLKLDKTRLNPKSTEYMLNSPILKQYSSDGTRGVGNKNLVLRFIKEFPMPVPPLVEQRRIVAYLDSVQARLASLRELQSATGEELDALLPSVLDRAFKGEL